MALTQAQANVIIDKLEGKIPPSVGNTTRGINGHVITVEGVADVSSGGQDTSPGACAGAQARFAAANAAGGVDGYTFRYVGCDDSASSATNAVQDFQKAVNTDHAFAIVPESSSSAAATFLNQNHVPYFGEGQGPAYCPGWASLAYGFSPIDGSGCTLAPAKPNFSVLSDEGLAVISKGLKMPESSIRWAFVADNVAFIKTIDDDYASIITQALHGTVAYNGTPGPAPGQPPLADWTPVAQQIISSNANVVDITYLAGSDLYGFLQALKANGYKGVIYSSGGAGVDDATTLANPTLAKIVNGVYVQTPFGGSTVFPGNGVDVIATDLKAIHSTVDPNDLTTVFSFTAADAFIDALSDAAKLPGPLTSEKLMNMINAGWTYPGLPNNGYSPIPYPGGRLSQTTWAGLVQVVNDKVVPIQVPGPWGADFFESVSS